MIILEMSERAHQIHASCTYRRVSGEGQVAMMAVVRSVGTSWGIDRDCLGGFELSDKVHFDVCLERKC